MREILAEQLTAPDAEHGEGVVWCAGWTGPRWVDMLRGDVLSLDPVSGAVARLGTGTSHAVLVRPRRRGGLLVGTASGVLLYPEGADAPERTIAGPPLAPGERFNEGTCDPRGGLLLGTLHKPRLAGAAALHRLDRDGAWTAVLTGLTLANGVGFAPSGAELYHVDSADGLIRRVRCAVRVPWSAEPFVDMRGIGGEPDGLCVDAEGGVWVAVYGAGVVHRYAPDGSLSAVVRLPVSQPTACCIAPDGSLLVSTSSLGAGAERGRGAGALFRADVRVRPLPLHASAL